MGNWKLARKYPAVCYFKNDKFKFIQQGELEYEDIFTHILPVQPKASGTSVQIYYGDLADINNTGSGEIPKFYEKEIHSPHRLLER